MHFPGAVIVAQLSLATIILNSYRGRQVFLHWP